jgi:hypothetical protein
MDYAAPPRKLKSPNISYFQRMHSPEGAVLDTVTVTIMPGRATRYQQAAQIGQVPGG